MATASKREEENLELKVCCICLEHYKTPRCLPCSHSFCEACLSGHIQSSCSDFNPPLGFPCPLCQVFVPAPGRFAQYSFNDWAKIFPENKFLASIAVNDASLTSIPCHPCKEDGEDARGTSWCVECSDVLCDECAKYHRRARPCRHHEVVSLTNISQTLSQNYPGLENCETHEGRKIEALCENHLAPCCALCVIKEHGGCSSLCQIEEAAEKLLGTDNVKNLQDDVKELCTDVEGIIKRNKVNIDKIDDVSDRFTKEISDATAAIIQAVKNLEETHLDELAKSCKESKSKLEKSIKCLEQRLQYLHYWGKILQRNFSTDINPKICSVLTYSKTKHIYENLRRLEYTQLKISVKTELHDDVRKLIDLPSLAAITTTEYQNPVMLYSVIKLKNAEVKQVSNFKVYGTDFYGGVFLQNDQLLLADYSREKCILYSIDGVILHSISTGGSPWGVCAIGENDVLVGLPDDRKILRLSHSLQNLQTVQVDSKCYGISTFGNTIAIGNRDSVEIFDSRFQKVRYSNNLSHTDDVAVDDEENVIYSSHDESTVRKVDRKGNILFTYSHEELKKPFGLTVDRVGNIYVNGFKSNNVHILSRSGEVVRILNGVVTSPMCINIQEEGNRFFVIEIGGRVRCLNDLLATDDVAVDDEESVIYSSHDRDLLIMGYVLYFTSTRSVTMADQVKFPYCRAVMYEVLRVSDNVVIPPVHTFSEDIEVKGFTLPTDAWLMPVLSTVHLDPAIFPEPEKFKPERFLNENGELTGYEKVDATFSLGPRDCLAKNLGKMEIFLFLTTLVQNYDIENEAGKPLPSLGGMSRGFRRAIPYEVCLKKRNLINGR
ncbi:tripartite motif-containing protein 3-like [Ostrea edulis]|uniref:tripartite motif-containing protein 3-like n=1 Tax=Ostrea edulis TaxID=37623 RepID=UPI0024AF7B9B|nr:tripartite motif-containing protein 3-like [Ostrea edulis]